MHTARDIIQNYMSIEYFLGEIHPTSEFISTWIYIDRDNIDVHNKNEYFLVAVYSTIGFTSK
jgi:hypothetical protein